MKPSAENASSFPIPTSLQDLERPPYNVLPYPPDFEDDDEAARADSFDNLVLVVEQGNRTLSQGGSALFTSEADDKFGVWMDNERLQALYTLVRKSSSLAPGTRKKLISALCRAVHSLCDILSSSDDDLSDNETSPNESSSMTDEATNPVHPDKPSVPYVMSQSFRDAFACHIYMLYCVMFIRESEAKHSTSSKSTSTTAKASGKSRKKKQSVTRENEAESAASREECAESMLAAARTMAKYKSKLWKRAVPDEDVVNIPCRIAYQMLENARGVEGRKLASADAALGMIAATVDSASCLMSTVVAALVDLLHSFEHMAALVAELCCMVSETPVNRLAVELLREIGRLDTKTYGGSTGGSDAVGKASGIRNVAPFISELADKKPHFVLAHISLVLPHLDSEPYNLRSAIVTAIAHIITKSENDDGRIGSHQIANPDNDNEGDEDPDDNAPHHRNVKKSRNALLDVLTERAHDKSSFTRVAVLKAWATVVKNECLPLERVLPVTALAIDRLQDKAVIVRRYALQLLTLMLENNPFSGELEPSPYRAKIAELQEYLMANMPSNLKEARDSASSEIQEEEKEKIETAALAAAMSDSLTNSTDELSEAEKEYKSKVKALQFATSALAFIDLFQSATSAFESMLLSSNTSDVTEALHFFVRARHFQLPCAVTGMKRALALMWSTEKNIKDEVLRAFVDVFIAVPGTDGEELLPDKQIVHNLLVLAGEASVSELASIEEAMKCLVEQEVIPAEVFLILWSVATKAPGEARAAAMLVLSMGATSDPSIVDSASRLSLLLEAGLGDYAEEHRDWKTARSAACALQQIKSKPPPGSAKMIVLELIAERLCVVIRGDWCRDDVVRDTTGWFCAAEQAINALFVIWPEPEKACAEIIRGMESTTFGFAVGSPRSKCSAQRLSRFLFVIGHIALKLLVYTENVSSAVRRANAAKTLSKQESVDKAKAKAKAKKKAKESSENENDEEGSDEDDAIEAELGLAAEAEAETERQVAEISEKEIVGRGLIGLFGPMLVRIVDNKEGHFSSEILMQSATLALCKSMCISSAFCEKHLPLLFEALSKAPTKDTILRANTAVALGDLAFRFPNAVEPYTPKIYALLRDNSTRVKRHTLMVLTHLILNDMVKVKGQVCEIALCLEDEEVRIRDMARLFFTELSKRSNNPIYNLLPDIISRMSQMDIPKKVFQNILSFLIKFIDKDRQNEMLVEKLCHRFPTCTSISQKADMAFCLSHLKINGKCIKCLNDLFKCYKDALFDKDVFDCFASIVFKAKKSIKPETKEILEEWEEKLTNENSKGMEDHLAGNKAERAKARAALRAARNASKTGRRAVPRRKKKEEYEGETDESEDVSDDDDDTIEKENRSPTSNSHQMKRLDSGVRGSGSRNRRKKLRSRG